MRPRLRGRGVLIHYASTGEVGAAGRSSNHGEPATASGELTMATGASEEGEMGRVRASPRARDSPFFLFFLCCLYLIYFATYIILFNMKMVCIIVLHHVSIPQKVWGFSKMFCYLFLCCNY